MNLDPNYKGVTVTVGSLWENNVKGYHVEVIGKKLGENRLYCKFPCGTISDISHSSLLRGTFRPPYLMDSKYKIVGCRYKAMKHRCDNESNDMYYLYGGRGVKCLFKSSWEYLFHIMQLENFDNMLKKPKLYDIDRIDTNGHYEIGNLRIITKSENLKNRRTYTFNDYILEIDGIEFASLRELGDYMRLGDRKGIKKRFKENQDKKSFIYKGKEIKIKYFKKWSDKK